MATAAIPELTVSSLIPTSKPARHSAPRSTSGSFRSQRAIWDPKRSLDRAVTSVGGVTSGVNPHLNFSPRESNISVALDQVMRINVNDSSGLKPYTSGANIRSPKHAPTPRDSQDLDALSQRQIMFNLKPQFANLRDSHALIAEDEDQRRSMISPAVKKIQPFHEQHSFPQQTNRTALEGDGGSVLQSKAIHKMPEWGKNSEGRNMAGTQTHYMLYLRSLREQQHFDQKTHSKRVDSSIQRIHQGKHSARVGQRSVTFSAGDKKRQHMCHLNETWDVANTGTASQQNHRSSLGKWGERKKEFERELLYQKQKKQHINIRSSETPRTDEGILDWLLRSVTSVPLDSKYAPRTTTRLFQLSVHALENQLSTAATPSDAKSRAKSAAATSGLTQGQSEITRCLYIDPYVRAQTAKQSSRSEVIDLVPFVKSGRSTARSRGVKSAGVTAAGRIPLNVEESTEERVESSRKLWSAHHQHNYERRQQIGPKVFFTVHRLCRPIRGSTTRISATRCFIWCSLSEIHSASDIGLEFGKEVLEEFLPEEINRSYANIDNEADWLEEDAVDTMCGLTSLDKDDNNSTAHFDTSELQ